MSSVSDVRLSPGAYDFNAISLEISGGCSRAVAFLPMTRSRADDHIFGEVSTF